MNQEESTPPLIVCYQNSYDLNLINCLDPDPNDGQIL